MKIVIDTREQKPLDFTKALLKTEVRTLKTGDYSLEGKEDLVCVERKSISDLVNTLIHSKARFARELDRMQLYKYKAILVEGSMYDIERHNYRSKVHPNAVRGLVAWIWVCTGIPTFFCDDADMCAAWVVSTFRAIEKREDKLAPSTTQQPTIPGGDR